MRAFVACVLVLKIASCYGQFEKNICVGDVEIAFSTKAETFNRARSSCQNFGGDLVKIGNAAIQAAIQNTVVVKPEYYIGAYDDDDDMAYHWLIDNTPVPKNPGLPYPGPSIGYENWKSNQPNNKPEKCTAVGVHSVYTWVDIYCNSFYRYICQRDLIRVSYSANSATCQSLLLSVEVRWKKSSVIVVSSDKGGVYQTIGSNNATLYYANANISEAGTYTCTTTGSSCSAEKAHTIAVDGTPTIQSVVGGKCNTFLYVTWKPNKAAVGFKHRIKAPGTDSIFYAIPDSDNYITTEVRNLDFLTNYTIQIQVCETEDSCTTSFTSKSNGSTGGVTDPVTNATVEYSNGCKATWKSSENSVLYGIKTKCTEDQYREGEDVYTVTKTVENLENETFQFQPGGNRVCSATIWAKGCERISTYVRATGSCRTPPKEPEEIELPAIEINGASKTIKMSKPSEDNGLISCIFIVLCYNKCSETQFTVLDLEKASQTDATNNTDYANSIALASSMSSVSGNQISSELFRGEETSCDLYNTGLVAARSSSKVIKGNNVIDNNTKNVWAYAVTSTPSGSKILLQTSNPIVVLKEVQQATTTAGSDGENAVTTLNIGLVIGLIVGVIAIIIIIVVVVIIVKRKQTGAQKDSARNSNSQTESGNRVAMAQTQDTSPYAYENEPAGQEYEEIKSSERQRIQSRQQNQRTTSQTRNTESLTMAPQHGQTDSPYLNEPSNPAYEEIKESGGQDSAAYENFNA